MFASVAAVCAASVRFSVGVAVLGLLVAGGCVCRWSPGGISSSVWFQLLWWPGSWLDRRVRVGAVFVRSSAASASSWGGVFSVGGIVADICCVAA